MTQIHQLLRDVNELKEATRNSEYQFQQTVSSEFKRRQRTEIQSEDLPGLHTAVVVDTVDPLKQGRVRFYTPYLSNRVNESESLPWASPVSPFGGFDDSGCIWVPPAGSKIVIFFDNGNVDSAYYIGTIWNRHRGSDGNHLPFWDNYPIDEYACIWDGRRNGYLVGDNTGDQVLPPWNTEMYNGYDNDSITDFYKDPQQYNSITNPYIKGFKTEQKHYLKFVEGDPRCNRRWSRVEFGSGRGNIIMFKDDHLHPAGQWAFSGDAADPDDPIHFCHLPEPDETTPKEHVCCDGDGGSPSKCFPPQCLPKKCPEKDVSNSSIDRSRRFANPYYKRSEEMRPYTGANTPQANKCELDQSGIFMQSLSGNQFFMDDSVNQPTGVPSWDREFDYGCDDVYKGKIVMKGAHGHVFTINESEDDSNVRGEDNSISMRTASGNFFELNDHTLPNGDCDQKIAGPRRGVTMSTTSTHLFQMIDHRNEQSSPKRTDGGVPKPCDKDGFEGYCLLRSGYGLQILLKDDDRQDATRQQFIQILSPQTDNVERGPHMMVMQEQPEGPGLVMLRAGGVYMVSSYDDSMEVVGDEEANPASKFLSVSDSYLIDVKKTYYNHNDNTIFFSENFIYMMSGRDCPPPPKDAEETAEQSLAEQSRSIEAAMQNPGTNAGQSDECGPCLYNVIVSKDPWVCPLTQYVHYGVQADESGNLLLDSRSKRMFASAVNETGSQGCVGGKPEAANA